MNVLYVGSMQGTSGALHYYASFVRQGHNVLPLDPEYFRSDSSMDRLRTRLNKAPLEKKRRAVHRILVELCQKNHFDVVFVMAENFLGAETLTEIRKLSRPPRFVYHSHDNNFSDGILKPADFFSTLAAYDLAFTTKSRNVRRYGDIGQKQAHFIPSAFEPMVHRPIPNNESRVPGPYTVVFVGTYDRSRDPYLEAVGWDRLHVWGNRWERFEGQVAHGDRITPHAVYHFEQADIVSHSRLALGLLREEAEDLHTQRTFEIPACRGVQVAPRNDEILSFFKEDREIICFEGVEEFKEKVNHYLAHPEAAHKISVGGYRRCMEDGHTYDDRVKTILEKLEALGRPKVAV